MIGKSSAVVLGSVPLGESDLIVSFFSRRYGKVRGVARRARRMKSRFGGALEVFTLGELIFFDGGRSELVQVDHFDIARPFARVRDDLLRLGEAAWVVECLARLTADRDPNPLVFGLLVRALTAVEAGVPPARVAVAFGLKCIEALGHRLRIDRCVRCHRPATGTATVAIDLEAGGVLCAPCSGRSGHSLPLSRATLAVLRNLETSAWAEALEIRRGRTGAELRDLLEAHVTYLAGQPIRAARFLREVTRAPSMYATGPGSGRAR